MPGLSSSGDGSRVSSSNGLLTDWCWTPRSSSRSSAHHWGRRCQARQLRTTAVGAVSPGLRAPEQDLTERTRRPCSKQIGVAASSGCRSRPSTNRRSSCCTWCGRSGKRPVWLSINAVRVILREFGLPIRIGARATLTKAPPGWRMRPSRCPTWSVTPSQSPRGGPRARGADRDHRPHLARGGPRGCGRASAYSDSRCRRHHGNGADRGRRTYPRLSPGPPLRSWLGLTPGIIERQSPTSRRHQQAGRRLSALAC